MAPERRWPLAAVLVALVLVGAGIAITSGGDEPARPLYVDRESLGGRCDDGRSRGAVARGAPWCSLERALEAAGGGRTVYVRRGSYPGLELRGERRAYLTLKPFRGERVRLGGLSGRDSSFLERGVYAGDSGFLRLEGFRVTGPIELLFGSRRIQLVENDISGPLHLRLTRQVLIERNYIHDIPRGVRALGADGYAENPARRGVFGLTVRDNRFERASNDAIAVYGGAYGLLVEGNEIAHVHAPAGSDLHVDAIQTQGGRRMVIRANFIHDVDAGMILKDALRLERLVIENNLVVRTPSWGVLVYDAPGARIQNNTIWDTAAGLGIYDLPEVPGPQTSARLRNNIIDWLQLQQPSFIAAQDHNLIAKGRGRPGPHDISDPSGYLPQARWPRFRNPKRLDYRPRSASPGVDGGTRRGTPVRDALGRRPSRKRARRKRGKRLVPLKDMGALEASTRSRALRRSPQPAP